MNYIQWMLKNVDTHRWTVFLTSATSPPPPPRNPGDPPPEFDIDYLPGGADDLSYLIKRVTFRLHETYPNPNRSKLSAPHVVSPWCCGNRQRTRADSALVFDKPPYKVVETGWGEFTVQIRVQFIAEASEKPLTLSHGIKLHHWGPPIEMPEPKPQATPAPATATTQGKPGADVSATPGGTTTPATGEATAGPSAAGTPAPTQPGANATGSMETGPLSASADGPAEQQAKPDATAAANDDPSSLKPAEVTVGTSGAAKDQDAQDKSEPVTETPSESAAPVENAKTTTGEGETDADVKPSPETALRPSADPEAEGETQANADANDTITVQRLVPASQSIAARLPVHAWQYDEIVFTDPPANFLNILNAHPPTPLPAKNRRPRDQREAELGPDKKAKKGKGSAGAGRGRGSTIGMGMGMGTNAGTVAGTGTVAGSRAQSQEPGTPGAIGGGVMGPDGVIYGINGEPGSADVPLEFTLEMEKVEWNLLQETRIAIIDQMDRWR